ncbi:efflux RND transporter periplasmic adaptor subunit [Enterobacillus tribolii]|uniref:Membrane fusion protein (Multidrug efflux system) n=1 Tax=Enterobacillus tribolii TaxID=1487935 RepID=A0A370QHW0_9GAMM|nr:efflux RND transporter periplasmic adaptor subunit [Enterobacillus tribolii]MBW7982665.1 efflux RND transporter periplasmic adaptor subunit [Enterobacillus tribolii]RDK87944.1 membrane fusion protein (multidrug efflux system) [Enterobacillus tribolii]
MKRLGKHVRFVPVMLFVSGALLSGCHDNNEQKEQGSPPLVEVVTLKTEPLPIVTELPGRTSAYRVAQVRPQVDGIILKRNFTEGSDVQAGQSLYQIDPATYQAAYDSARGELLKAQAAAGIANLTVARYKPLLKSSYVSKQDYDSAVSTAEQAAAAVKAAQAQLETTRINLAYTRVNAPISGRSGTSSVTEGALVNATQTKALTTVQQIDPLYVDVTQSSADFLRLKQAVADGGLQRDAKGADVTLVLDNGQAYPVTGRLEFSDVTVDQSTGSITIRALFPNPQHDLLPGMFVRARISEGLKPDALLVPQEGVTRNPRGDATVLVVDGDNKVQTRGVTASRAVGDRWLIDSGLKEGERVIVSGQQKVRPGMTVRVQDAAEQTAPATAGK